MVTIIVLLILAAVAISLSIGDNGIITSARNATDKWEEGTMNEQDELKQLANFIKNNINDSNNSKIDKWNTATNIKDAKKQNLPFENDITIKDELQNEVRIPGGFKLSADSAELVEDGIVIEDEDGNQFVWIPAKTDSGITVHTKNGDKNIIYERRSYNYDIETKYTEELQIDEKNSIDKNGGYYIGRFEAGDAVVTKAGRMRVEGDSEQNEISIKSGQTPYNFVTYESLKNIAEKMAKQQEYTRNNKANK